MLRMLYWLFKKEVGGVFDEETDSDDRNGRGFLVSTHVKNTKFKT